MQPDHLTYWEKEEEENSKKGIIGSVCFHSLLLLIFLLPWFKSVDPPKGPDGVLISLGVPTMIDTEEPSPAKSSESLAYKDEDTEQKAEEVKPSEKAPSESKPKEVVKTAKEAPTKEVPAKFIKTVKNTQEESPVKIKEDKEKKEEELREELKRKDAIAAQEAKAKAEQEKAEQQHQAKLKEEAEARNQAEAAEKKRAEEQRKRVEEAARKKRAEEQRKQEAYERTKSELGNLFDGNGDNAESQGKKGDSDGSSDSKILDGLSGGLGAVGGGLAGRGVIFEPQIVENSQKTGKVVVKVCVDQSGEVISAKYTQRGSTTTDSDLVDVAQKAALKYKFTPGDLAEQCGTITIDFKLQ